MATPPGSPDEPVAVGPAALGGDEPVAVGDAALAGTPINQADAPVAIGGKATAPHTGFWADFGQGTGGVTGLIEAPFTSSIPAEFVKGEARTIREHGLLAGTTAGLVYNRFKQVLDAPDDKPLTQQMREQFGAIVAQARKTPGLFVGSLVKGIVADPELFFAPELGAEKLGAAGEAVAKTAGAGPGAARAVGATTHAAGRVAGAASIGGGAEAAREFGEGEPENRGAIALSALIATPAAAVQIPLRRKGPLIPAEDASRILGTSAAAGVKPDMEVVPVAGGYTVRVKGEKDAITFSKKEDAEAAREELERLSSAYRVMDTVPRGTESGPAQRARLMAENPFTPEKMEKMIKRASQPIRMSREELTKWLGGMAASMAIGGSLGYYLDREDPGTGAEFGVAIGALPRLIPKDRRLSIEEPINARNGLLAAFARRTLQFKTAIDTTVPEALRRSAISLALEGTPGIKLSPQEAEVAAQVRQFYDAMGQTAVDAGVLKELLHDYVTHIVEENPDAAAKSAIDRIVEVLAGKARAGSQSGRQFAQHRQYATFGELQAALRGSNLRIKTGDIGEIVSIYAKAMFRTITDRRLIEALKQTPVEAMGPMLMPRGIKDIVIQGHKAIQREPLEATARELPPDDRTLPPPRDNLPATTSAATVAPGGGAPPPGAGQEGGGFKLPPEPPPGPAALKYAARVKQAKILMPIDEADTNYVVLPNRQLAGYAVHRDVAAQLNFIFNARDPNDVTLGLMALNQASKRAIVSFSLFHAKSLSDAFIGAMGGKTLLHPKAAVKAALDQFLRGGSNDGIDALLRHGLNVQLPEDVTTDHLHGALAKIAAVLDKALPVTGAGAAVRGGANALSHFNNALDRFTFYTLQTGFKLVTGLDALERLEKKGVPRDRAARLAASYANDIYGGLDWFRVANDVGSRIGRDLVYGFFNPNGRRWMQLMLFAPDWTISTFRSAYKALPGAVDDGALAALHRRYLAKSAFYYLTIANALNLLTAGHSIFSNQNPTRVQLGDGRTMQWSKHFMEPFEWLHDPIQTADNKLAFIPRTAVELGTGKEYISAYDAAPDLESRAELVARQFLPINAQQGLAGGGAESLTGLLGAPIYGKTPEQKTGDRLAKKKAQLEKKRRAAEYYRRTNQ